LLLRDIGLYGIIITIAMVMLLREAYYMYTILYAAVTITFIMLDNI
jgi:hypothetical protein